MPCLPDKNAYICKMNRRWLDNQDHCTENVNYTKTQIDLELRYMLRKSELKIISEILGK